jgi:EAL domain-containing protein (putative c-di-GMP-specific phosphodiesterase class I)
MADPTDADFIAPESPAEIRVQTPIGSNFSMPEAFPSDAITDHNILWLDLREQPTTELLLSIRALGVGVFEVRNIIAATDALTTQSYGAAVVCGNTSECEEMLNVIRDHSDFSTLPVLALCVDVSDENKTALLESGATDVISLDTPHREALARLSVQLRAVTNWSRVVENKVRERSALSQALSQVSPQATPELTADVICFELSLVRKFAGVAVIAFSHDGSAQVLAHHGQAMAEVTPGGKFNDITSRYLQDHARSGPWIEQFSVGVPLGASIHGARPGPDYASAAAVSPLVLDGEILGLLFLGNEPGRPANGTNMAETITAAIDFARVAVGLLAPGLRERDNVKARKLGLDVVIAERRFTPVYQAINDLSSGKTVGYEALCRFHDNTRPDIRFAEASRVGVGKQLELAVVDEALKQAAILPAGTWLSVNVSPYVLLATSDLAEVLHKADRPITIELTEHDRVDDYSMVRAALSSLGPDVRLSVDDAGSGFASLRHVLALEPHFVKLDHSWVTGVHLDPARRALVAGLQHFAQETGCSLIAEGIENEIELNTLKELNVQYGQGFFLHRPSPAGEIFIK